MKFENIDLDELEFDLAQMVEDFRKNIEPLEGKGLVLLADALTGAIYTECHVLGSVLISNGTTDVPLDPELSPEYRANRELVTSHSAFEQMKSDALGGRSFSNIVCEFDQTSEPSLKVIGGQHRFDAVDDALESEVDMYHGLKVYFGLDKEQRLDVQVISNTNITVPADLLDRMYATIEGSDLRKWCQFCGLLEKGQDFSDKNKRGNPITVREARTFVVNYLLGKELSNKDFDTVDTTPQVVASGEREPALWKKFKSENPDLWSDSGLQKAGKEFALLINAQKEFFRDKKTDKLVGKSHSIHKTKNIALLAAFALVAGSLHNNQTRLLKHFSLKDQKTREPLRSELLAKGRHASDPENYRGLGFRTDPKERGRFAELFYLHAEKGGGFTTPLIDAAIKGYEAKRAHLALQEAKAKL